MALFTVAMLAGYVLPQFKPLFEELNADLPLPTRMLLFVADLFTDLWYIPPSFFARRRPVLVWLFKTAKGKLVKDKLVLKIPIIKGIIEYAILERFCRILGGDGQGRRAAARRAEDHDRVDAATRLPRAARGGAEQSCSKGGGFAKPLADTGLFPGAARQMFKVGEETGTLDDQLEVASIYFDRELESRIKKFTTMFEPIMIVFVGVIVGFVAVALVSAMYGVLDRDEGRRI